MKRMQRWSGVGGWGWGGVPQIFTLVSLNDNKWNLILSQPVSPHQPGPGGAFGNKRASSPAACVLLTTVRKATLNAPPPHPPSPPLTRDVPLCSVRQL